MIEKAEGPESFESSFLSKLLAGPRKMQELGKIAFEGENTRKERDEKTEAVATFIHEFLIFKKVHNFLSKPLERFSRYSAEGAITSDTPVTTLQERLNK